jgi:hypothetical protein
MHIFFSKRLMGFVGTVVLSLACMFGSPATTTAQMPRTNPAQISKDVARQEWLDVYQRVIDGQFPRLGVNFKVKGPHTTTYNCIAHSLGLNDRWVNPITGPGDAPLALMDRLYAAQGYKRERGLNTALEAGKQKVVVYATLNRDATIGEVTHAAIQQPDGTWTSKLGSLALIQHPTPESLRGPVYGTPVAVYVR